MNTKNEIELPPDIAEWLATVPKTTDAMRARLRAAAKELDADAEFQSDYIKGRFVNFMIEAINEEKLTQSDVARKWGRSRQYLHKLLNEDKRVNFTIETMVELAMLLGRRIEMHVFKQNETAHVLRCVTRQSSYSLSDDPTVVRSRKAEYLTTSFTPFESCTHIPNENRLSA